MNYTYFVDLSSWFVISFLIISVISNTVSSILDWLNLDCGNFKMKLSRLHRWKLAKTIFTAKALNKAKKYKKTVDEFNDVVTSISSNLSTLFIVFGVLPFMVSTVSTLFPGLSIMWCWVGVTTLTSFMAHLLKLPVNYHSTFVIEKKFGFNKTKMSTFITDQLLSFFIGLAFSIATIVFVSYLLSCFADLSTTSLILFAASFMVFIKLSGAIYTMMIMPLFNKFTPLEDKKLVEKLEKLCKKCNFKIEGIYVMDASKRSTHSNAFIFKRFMKNRIVLFDTLLKNLTHGEIVSIVAHEIGHGKLHHLGISELMATVSTVFIASCTFTLMKIPGFYNAFGYSWVTMDNLHENMIIGFYTAIMFVCSFMWLLTPVTSWLSRKMEYAADRYAVIHTGGGTNLVNALFKLTAENLSNVFSHPAYEFVHYSHPSILNRVEAISKIKVPDKE